MMKTSLDSFKKLRSMSPDDPERERLRNRICEENLRLAYDAVNKAGGWLLSMFSGGMREEMLNDLRQLAVDELLRVIVAYDPERLNPNNPGKPIEFSTFAYANLVPKIKSQCKKIAHEQSLNIPLFGPDDDDDESALDDIAAPPSSEEIDLQREEQIKDYFSRMSDPSLTARLQAILDKLWNGDGVTLFERQLLFKLIADPTVVLTPHQRAGTGYFGAAKFYEPLPLRRHRLWRQVLN